MSTAALAAAPTTTEAMQTNSIRDTMSLANLLTESTPVPTSSPPPSPSTPTKALGPKEEALSSPDTTMSDGPVLEGKDKDANDGEDLKDVDDADDGEDFEDVDDADREFICMNDPCGRCHTGQYTKDLSRKVISDHFGRNKACTRDIVDWPLYCRKHYQRATYNKDKWQLRKVQLINRQFDVIEAQFPTTTYDILLKKSEEARLNQYSRRVAAGMSTKDAEESVAPVAGKHFEASIDVLRELDGELGKGRTLHEVKKVMNIILQMLEDKESEQVPSIEFLPQLPGKTPKGTPTKARVTKSPKKPRTPKTPKTPSRVSTKGSVKKPSQKA